LGLMTDEFTNIKTRMAEHLRRLLDKKNNEDLEGRSFPSLPSIAF
jgi:hypothetical protein